MAHPSARWSKPTPPACWLSRPRNASAVVRIESTPLLAEPGAGALDRAFLTARAGALAQLLPMPLQQQEGSGTCRGRLRQCFAEQTLRQLVRRPVVRRDVAALEPHDHVRAIR